MNVIKCKNGHFYDADKFESCPHCGESRIKEDFAKKKVVSEKQETTVGIFNESLDSESFTGEEQNSNESQAESTTEKRVDLPEYPKKTEAPNSKLDNATPIENDKKQRKFIPVLIVSIVGIIVVVSIIILVVMNSNKPNDNKQEISPATTTSSVNVTETVTEKETEQTIVATSIAPTSFAETESEQIVPDGWLTINAIEKDDNSFADIVSCNFSGSNLLDNDFDLEGPVIYGTLDYSIDISNQPDASFSSHLVYPDGTLYTGYDFVTSWVDNRFAVSLPKRLPPNDYTFELELFAGDYSSKNTVRFTIN